MILQTILTESSEGLFTHVRQIPDVNISWIMAYTFGGTKIMQNTFVQSPISLLHIILIYNFKPVIKLVPTKNPQTDRV